MNRFAVKGAQHAYIIASALVSIQFQPLLRGLNENSQYRDAIPYTTGAWQDAVIFSYIGNCSSTEYDNSVFVLHSENPPFQVPKYCININCKELSETGHLYRYPLIIT